jgi:hypothetical protein
VIKQLKGGKIYFILVSEVSVHHDREGMAEQSSIPHGGLESKRECLS